jgi:hypothetical protein
MIKSLGNGLVGIKETQLYIAPNNTATTTTLISFVNKSASDITLNFYKRVRNVQYQISPYNFILKANHLAQEDGTITLQPSDGLFAIASTDAVITYVVNGIEQNIQSQNPELRPT